MAPHDKLAQSKGSQADGMQACSSVRAGLCSV